MAKPFVFYSAAVLNRTTGYQADNLRALVRGLQRVPDGAIFYHLHYALFRRHFTTAEFLNDFARWVWRVLHEETLAERLAALDPLDFCSLADARHRLIGEVERYLGEAEFVQHVSREATFHFLDAQMFVFSTGVQAADLMEFAQKIRTVGADSIFHHVVSAPLRLGQRDNDFSCWMAHECGRPELAERLRAISPYTEDLFQLRDCIADLVAKHA